MNNNSGFVSIGYGNYLNLSRIVGILNPEGSASKRLKEYAREKGVLFDATQGRKTRSIIVLDSNQVFLSAFQTETLIQRISIDIDNIKN